MKAKSAALGLLILVLFLWQCKSSQQPISITYAPPDASIFWPSEAMKKEFIQYWTLRSEGAYEETFKMEAPYLQEIVPIAIYRSYVDNRKRKISGIRLIRLDSEISGAWIASIELIYGDEHKGSDGVFLKDRWVQVGNRWYHVIRDPVMVKFFP